MPIGKPIKPDKKATYGNKPIGLPVQEPYSYKVPTIKGKIKNGSNVKKAISKA
jgi:hypothetical protein